MRDYILLYVNGRRHEVRGAEAFGPLSNFLRTTLRLPGTKVVCAEGDCGSCTVLVGRPRGGRLEYRPVTSCIQYLAQLDGAHVVTVEGLQYDGRLNPLQQAMVDQHGAQCGYCTPGVVVSLCALFDQEKNPSRHDVCRSLVGNLCRCTGYDSILAAAANTDRTAWRRLSELYPAEDMVRELERVTAESVEVGFGDKRLYKPATLAEAVRLRTAQPEGVVLAGGTDLGVGWNKGTREVGTLLCIGELDELKGCGVSGGIWSIGAATTIAELEQSARAALPSYAHMLERFGSPPIKNAGTLGGNLANASPIGDSMPALMVLDAEVEAISPRGTRRININEFYTGYRKTALAQDELICRVAVPLPGRDELFGVYKVSKRRDLDISTFAAAVWMHIEGDIIRAVRIAYGGVAPTIVRLRRTEAWLSERRLSEATMRQAGKLACEEISPISDVRGSARYRALLGENILVKFAREAMSQQIAATNGNE